MHQTHSNTAPEVPETTQDTWLKATNAALSGRFKEAFLLSKVVLDSSYPHHGLYHLISGMEASQNRDFDKMVACYSLATNLAFSDAPGVSMEFTSLIFNSITETFDHLESLPLGKADKTSLKITMVDLAYGLERLGLAPVLAECLAQRTAKESAPLEQYQSYFLTNTRLRASQQDTLTLSGPYNKSLGDCVYLAFKRLCYNLQFSESESMGVYWSRLVHEDEDRILSNFVHSKLPLHEGLPSSADEIEPWMLELRSLVVSQVSVLTEPEKIDSSTFKSDGYSPLYCISVGKRLRAVGCLTEAIHTFERAAQLLARMPMGSFPSEIAVSVWFHLGTCTQELGHYQKSQFCFKMSCIYNPHSIEAWKQVYESIRLRSAMLDDLNPPTSMVSSKGEVSTGRPLAAAQTLGNNEMTDSLKVLEGALPVLDRLVELNTHLGPVIQWCYRRRKVDLLIKLGRMEDALAEISIGESGPNELKTSCDIWKCLVLIYMGDWEGAEKSLESASFGFRVQEMPWNFQYDEREDDLVTPHDFIARFKCASIFKQFRDGPKEGSQVAFPSHAVSALKSASPAQQKAYSRCKYMHSESVHHIATEQYSVICTSDLSPFPTDYTTLVDLLYFDLESKKAAGKVCDLALEKWPSFKPLKARKERLIRNPDIGTPQPHSSPL